MYELWWMDLTTCDVSAIWKGVMCQIHAKEMISPPGGGLGTRIWCGGQIRQLYAKIK